MTYGKELGQKQSQHEKDTINAASIPLTASLTSIYYGRGQSVEFIGVKEI
jgi:hypothetical protein